MLELFPHEERFLVELPEQGLNYEDEEDCGGGMQDPAQWLSLKALF